MRDVIKAALKTAMLEKDTHKISTIRLILAAIKDRDIASRGTEKEGTITNDDILQLLQSMVKQRQESITMYQKGGRQDLVDSEQFEIDVIKTFLPKQMNDDEMKAAIAEIIKSVGATGLKEMGAVMTGLRTQYAGCMDFGRASGFVKAALSGK
ncbi:MAG: GatB/YqeY domain-containing protein [Alphaproteobacteria bacterium]|nr:GatB/YqeY domain-containing protein [Alphaproteobacteria bacterium]